MAKVYKPAQQGRFYLLALFYAHIDQGPRRKP